MHVEGKCPKWEKIRGGVVALLMLGISGWFFVDGYIRYPKKNLRHAMENLPPGWPAPSEANWPKINDKVTAKGVAFDLLQGPGIETTTVVAVPEEVDEPQVVASEAQGISFEMKDGDLEIKVVHKSIDKPVSVSVSWP